MNKKTFFLIFPMLLALAAYGQPAKNGSLRYEVLLTRQMLAAAGLNAPFIKALDITASRLILLATSDRFYLLGWGGIKPVGQRVMGTISSFACTPDGFMMAIRDRELGHMSSRGNFSRLLGLPRRSMGMAAGKNVMYVYGRSKERQGNALYVIAKGGRYTKLFGIPTPINSVVEINNTILFATGSALFSYNIANKELSPLFGLAKDKEIISIAVDESSNQIYFSTAGSIYALNDNGASPISDQFGGVLKYFDDGLIVFDPGKKILIRIVGLTDKTGVAE